MLFRAMRRSEFTAADILKMDRLNAQSLVHFNKARLVSPFALHLTSPLAHQLALPLASRLASCRAGKKVQRLAQAEATLHPAHVRRHLAVRPAARVLVLLLRGLPPEGQEDRVRLELQGRAGAHYENVGDSIRQEHAQARKMDILLAV